VSTTLRLGTRGSPLALRQAEWVRQALQTVHSHLRCELQIIKTSGDRFQNAPLAGAGGKGLFVKEIEQALLEGRVDLAVHSLKDVPTILPPGLVLAAIPAREDAHDVLITADGRDFSDLPLGARLGTSSLRRQTQLRQARRDLTMVPLRGNVDTRLRRLLEGRCDALVLAQAGVRRLQAVVPGLAVLPFELCLPAIGQGALAIEAREDDETSRTTAAALDHPRSHQAVAAERALAAELGASCHTPLAAYAESDGQRLTLQAALCSLDGAKLVRGVVQGAAAEPRAVAAALAQQLRDQGAQAILDEIKARFA